VNVEEEYHEVDSSKEGRAGGTGRDAPVIPRQATAAGRTAV